MFYSYTDSLQYIDIDHFVLLFAFREHLIGQLEVPYVPAQRYNCNPSFSIADVEVCLLIVYILFIIVT